MTDDAREQADLDECHCLGRSAAEELLQHCKQGLARYKYPRWFNFVDSLPKTATGKIQRFKLRAARQYQEP